MGYGSTFKIFSEKELSKVLDARLWDMQGVINSKPDSYILNVSESEFIAYLVERYTMSNLVLHFDNISISTYEKQIPAKMFPGGDFLLNVEYGKTYPKDVIRYHIPFSGDDEILHCIPNPRTMKTIEVTISENSVCFDVINFQNDPERIKEEANSSISFLQKQSSYAFSQVRNFNSSLETQARKYFQSRKQHLLTKNNLIASLGVPIRKRENVSETFAIPTPQTRRKISISPPTVKEKDFKPEPTLPLSTYQDILKVIHDVGKQFERMPSTYSGKKEEDLRDHILLVLEPQFEGSATGETFNKTGKTDILLRHENTNVFIAECKFWKGARSFQATINQLLGYLTWRDSKAAIVVFVKNKDFSAVIETIIDETPKHPNYLGVVGKNEETWLDFRFHLNDNPNREVRLAVLLFHIPPA